MSIVAIITARGGSKRIPRKNIRHFLGRPILAYAIETAQKANCFDEVMVSTDDDEIATVAQQAGASVPFMRSPKNSDDHATTADALIEVIQAYQSIGRSFDMVCCIYPTTPLLKSHRLKEGYAKLIETGADSVFPIVRYGYPIQRSLKIEQGRAVMNWPENYNARSQDLKPIYHDCGQFYFMTVSALLSQKKLFAAHSVPIILDQSEVQDIDNEEDWRMAELKYAALKPD